MTTFQKITEDQYQVIKEDGSNFVFEGKNVIWTQAQVDRHLAWEERQRTQPPVVTRKVKGVVDNRHRNWRRRSY